LLLKNPWRSLFGGSWTLSNNANRWIRVSLQPTSVVAPAKRIISPVSLKRRDDAYQKRIEKRFFNAYLKRALISTTNQKTHSNGIYNAALSESRADFSPPFKEPLT
jgi:hypothetical protein